MTERRRLCVEFLGLPGSGKSTVSHATAAVLRRYGVAVDEPTWETDHAISDRRRYAYKTRRLAGEVWRRPGPAARAFGTVARTRQRRLGETLMTAANWLFVTSLIERPATPAVVQLIDEGLFQALWTVCFDAGVADPAELLMPLARAVRPPDLVVVLEAGPEEVRRRLERRPRGMSRMDGPAGRTEDGWWRAWRALAETRRMLDALARGAGRPLALRLRNERPDQVPHLAECLAAVVLSAIDGDLRRAPLAGYVLE